MTSSLQKPDLTQGSLWTQILWFSLPLVLSNLLQIVFNLADVAVVGRFVGPMALGAVGSTSMLVSMFIGFLIGLSGGINVLVARYYGANDTANLQDTVHTSAIVSLIIGFVLLTTGLLVSKPVLTMLGTKPELMDGALLYIRLYFLGMPAAAMFNYGNAVFSAAGNTKKPLHYLISSGVVNVILNLIFVIGFHMGVAGVALATILSQYLSAFLVLAALFRADERIGLRFSRLHLNRRMARDVLFLGIPGGLQNAIFALANLFIQAGINTFDAITVAGNSAALNSDNMSYEIMAAFYTACASFMGQNYGARKKDRVLKSFLISMFYAFLAGALWGGAMQLFGRSFLGLFSADSSVIDAAMKRMTIMSASYALSTFMDAPIAGCRALGKTILPSVFVFLGSCVFRVIWVKTVFVAIGTYPSLIMLYPVSWILTAVAETIYFIHVYRRAM